MESAIRAAAGGGRPALVAFVTAGYPTRAGFGPVLDEVLGAADVVEVGVPFSDPMADGATIQRASHEALRQGVTLAWILEILAQRGAHARTPVVLMSYLNPLLAAGLDRFPAQARAAGVAGVIIPDLPLEESAPVRDAFARAGLGLVQMATPVTPPERMRRLADAAEGFVYAVTVTGVTGGGGGTELTGVAPYLDALRASSARPVCAGFGIRRRESVDALAPHCDGVIVGSALIEALERGESPGAFLRSLRA